jgi:uncharacterized protein (TIGR02145 family)
MRKLVTVLAAAILIVSVFAQPPDKMSYQAVIRNSSDQLVASHAIGMKISILQGSATGTAVYTETQTPSSNANGLVSIEIGTGTSTDDFSAINWANGPYFIKTETDPTGGTGYTITGTSQILSVPYALHSRSSENGFASVYSVSDFRPVLSANGNIGIGTSSNWAKLDVNGQLNIGPGQNTWGSQILINAASLERGKEYKLTSTSGQGKLFFGCTGKGDVMVMDSNLNVGIGTINPVSKLDVMGEINVNSNKIINVADPLNNNDAATKAYVDALQNQIAALEINLLDAGIKAKDVDGNLYNTVKIGTQVWMKENLKTSKYSDGTAIPNVTDANAWSNLTTGAYVEYNNTSSNSSIYGKLYNYYTVIDARNLCPTGWHIPTDAEFTTLTNYLGGASVAGGKLKEIGTTHWTTPNTAADNTSGFTALPGGYRFTNGTFNSIGYIGFWWSSNDYSETIALDMGLSSTSGMVDRAPEYKQDGFSVRCVRD